MECGCTLPSIAAGLCGPHGLGSELNLLASAGSCHDLRRLQQRAIVQDRALRKPRKTSKTHGDRPMGKEGPLSQPHGGPCGSTRPSGPMRVPSKSTRLLCRCGARTATPSRSWQMNASVPRRPRASAPAANVEGTGIRMRSAQ